MIPSDIWDGAAIQQTSSAWCITAPLHPYLLFVTDLCLYPQICLRTKSHMLKVSIHSSRNLMFAQAIGQLHCCCGCVLESLASQLTPEAFVSCVRQPCTVLTSCPCFVLQGLLADPGSGRGMGRQVWGQTGAQFWGDLVVNGNSPDTPSS